MRKLSSLGKTKIICLIIAAIVFLFAVFQIGSYIESSLLPTVEPGSSSRTLEYNGQKYIPNSNVISVLLLGIDQDGEVRDSGYYRNDGLADFIAVFAFNTREKTCTVLQINRDTMTDINVIGLGGKNAGTTYAQIALSHSYGNGLEDSCINTKSAVSSLLKNIFISNYISLNMDGMALLNDYVGGVQVTVKDDFSQVDSSLIQGETITLTGEQALTYIRSRSGVSDQTNLSRMSRQQEYMQSFYSQLTKKISESSDSISEIFNTLDPYLVTDCNTGVLSTFGDRILEYDFSGVVTISGETTIGEDGIEFYADDDDLTQKVINIFYTPEQ